MKEKIVERTVFKVDGKKVREASLEELYGITRKDVSLFRDQLPSGKWLEKFESPGEVLEDVEFPEFTCKCPRTGHPDFATIRVVYIPDKWCVEYKALKYYLNSFRNEGHFHEQVMTLIYQELRAFLLPKKMCIIGEFNTRGGMAPVIRVGDGINEAFE